MAQGSPVHISKQVNLKLMFIIAILQLLVEPLGCPGGTLLLGPELAGGGGPNKPGVWKVPHYKLSGGVRISRGIGSLG